MIIRSAFMIIILLFNLNMFGTNSVTLNETQVDSISIYVSDPNTFYSVGLTRENFFQRVNEYNTLKNKNKINNICSIINHLQLERELNYSSNQQLLNIRKVLPHNTMLCFPSEAMFINTAMIIYKKHNDFDLVWISTDNRLFIHNGCYIITKDLRIKLLEIFDYH